MNSHSTSTKRKVCVVITARPSYSRIKTALDAIKAHPNLELQIVAAASALLHRYGNVADQIVDDGFQIDEKVFMVLEGENPTSMAKTTGMGILELATTFLNLQPDIVVSIADRYETIGTAIAGSYMNIPVAHVQGGEVTGSIDEKVRHAITKLSDVHLVASQDAEERVKRLGESPEQIYNTGCPSIDLAKQMLESPTLNFDPFERYKGVGPNLDLSNGYVVVMQHPVTTEYSQSRAHIEMTLAAVSNLNKPILWFWPNVDAGADGTSSGLRHFRELGQAGSFHFFKNMAPQDFLQLIYNSQCLVGNSSVGIRECAYLGIPVVNIGTRQSGRARGENVIDVTYSAKEIESAIRQQCSHGHYPSDPIYGDGTAGEQIANVLSQCKLGIDKRITY